MKARTTIGMGLVLLAVAPTAQASKAFLPQVAGMRVCFVTPSGKSRLTVCSANYTDVLLAVNYRRVQHPIAVGYARAAHRSIQGCECVAVSILTSARAKAKLTRRKFGDWWKNPRTQAGRRLKGCLKNAALTLAAYYASYVTTKHWDDSELLRLMALTCGAGAWVDAH